MFELLVEAGSRVIYKIPKTADRDREFVRVCKLYPGMRIEMDDNGDIIIALLEPPDSGFRNAEAFFQLNAWAQKNGDGIAFNGTVTWTLPSGAKRSPDASWVPKAMLRELSREELQSVGKARLCPPFVIEIRSPSDCLKAQQDRCGEWIRNGTYEVLLIDPQTRTVYRFFRSDDMETIVNHKQVESAHLSKFALECRPFWKQLVWGED